MAAEILPTQPISRRIHAVLAYDGISEPSRARHLSSVCGISESTARRLLSDRTKPTTPILIKLGDGLDVPFRWLWDGDLREFHLRACRVLLEKIKGVNPDDAARIIRFTMAYGASHKKADNLMRLIETKQIGLIAAARAYCGDSTGIRP